MPRRGVAGAWIGLLALWLAGCGIPVKTPPAGPSAGPTVMDANTWSTSDGAELPITRWRAGGERHGVVLALHGFAEHRDLFYTLAPDLAAAGYEVVAYDQRGFGETATRGRWPGRERLVGDARAAWRLLARRYPDQPIYLLGHSMGAAVAALAITGPDAIEPAGTVLLAPAVHGWETLPWWQEVTLTASAWLMPAASPRQSWGRAVAAVQVTDDPRIRRRQAGDPRILHSVRLDMLYGLVDLMDAALQTVPALPANTLIQYGARDDIIPARAACAMLERLERMPPPRPRFALYPRGYHYLARDLQRGHTIGDILGWLENPEQPLRSGATRPPATARRELCPASRAATDGGAQRPRDR